MQRFRFLALFVSTCLAVVSLPLLRRVVSLALCGLLFANSSVCYDLLGSDRVSAAVSGLEDAATSEVLEGEGQEIAVPPIIREAPIDLQNALPDDFVVSRQTPYSSGRNEVLIVSPSTGTEQRFEINLPGSSRFRLYRAAFSNVVIDDPARVIRDGSSLSPAQVRDKLESFTIHFNSQNLPSEVILSDGTKTEFSASEAVIRKANGQVIETVLLSSAEPSETLIASEKSVRTVIAQGSGCEGDASGQVYDSAQDAGSKANSLRNGQSDEAKASVWALTFGKQALEDSMIASSRNQTLQEVACKAPVQCNQEQTYSGGSEIRTDLFQLPSGSNPEISLEYEFYQIPDRLELYYEENIIFGVGPSSGRGTQSITSLPSGATYIGIKLIGNQEITTTEWWYTISCQIDPQIAEEPTPPTEDSSDENTNPIGISRWWATAGSSETIPVTWTVEIQEGEEGEYSIDIDRAGLTDWELEEPNGSRSVEIVIDDSRTITLNELEELEASADLGYLKAGKRSIKIDGFKPPDEPGIEKITFELSGPKEQKLEALFIADVNEPDLSESVKSRLAELYAPVLLFDRGALFDQGEIAGGFEEGYPMPFDAKGVWGNFRPKESGSTNESIDLSSYPNRRKKECNHGNSPTIYASFSEKGQKLAINYYFHYPISNWKFYGGYNQHQGDWEGLTLFMEYIGNSWVPKEVSFSQHLRAAFGVASDGGVTVPWDFIDHPIGELNRFNVYVGLGAHASFPYPGITNFITQRIELHKGDLDGCAPSPKVQIISHVGEIEPIETRHESPVNNNHGGSLGENDKSYEHNAWLLFPGRWGSDEGSPHGPVFLESSIFDLDILGDDQGLGLKWFNPWKWADNFETLNAGVNNIDFLDQKIALGNPGNPELEVDEKRSILVGGTESNFYKITGNSFPFLEGGSFIKDSGGEDVLELVIEVLPSSDDAVSVADQIIRPELSLARNLHRKSTSLIIDIDYDSQAEYLDDLSILNFFNSSGGRGIGFIEKVQNLSGDEILTSLRSD